ncbi:hypothetical protein [Desulfonatronum thioautotrophicum]|uniref:hypothetical protein n=1 Tax=Desulfonatronum thioautotrophicum TaxID=617001 RepID=UPI0005EB8BD1|nr:hypothetical protein [Desulfonatronum thioautotrophicum]
MTPVVSPASQAADFCAMLLAFHSLEEIYVRGRTVHFVGNGHRFYGNIECESLSCLRVGSLSLLPPNDTLLGGGQEWAFQLELTLDEDMARSGHERICFRFADQEQAAMAHQVFVDVAASILETASV